MGQGAAQKMAEVVAPFIGPQRERSGWNGGAAGKMAEVVAPFKYCSCYSILGVSQKTNTLNTKLEAKLNIIKDGRLVRHS
jgi:hypothetical protein